MNYKMMGRLIGLILVVEAAFMLPAAAICLYDRDWHVFYSFLVTMGLMLAVAALLLWVGHRADKGFYAREGMVCVGISWLVLSLFGCLPFWFSREVPHFIDALFETVSGFTTTGASVLPDVESLSRGLLYWRSFSHWLGGMGVLVFILAVIPISGRNTGFTVHLLRAESPGPNVGKLVPRMRQTATILYLIYILLTVLNFLFLLFGGMPVFDAVCTAIGTAGTGGFGIKNDSMASYSPYIQTVCTVFMLLFGVNFSCFYLLLLRRVRAVLRDEELHMYAALVVGSIVLITLNVRHMYPTIGETIHQAAFQVASVVTTTGFATTDFELWPSFSRALLLCLMVFGGCAGSTAGGMKCGRILLLIKALRRNVRRVLHPSKVESVRVNGEPVDEKVLQNTNAYLAAYVVILLVSFLILSLDGFSLTTNFSAALSCFNNIGPGLSAVGPTRNYAAFSDLSKVTLIVDMLAGRLEIFPVLALFSRSTWKGQ